MISLVFTGDRGRSSVGRASASQADLGGICGGDDWRRPPQKPPVLQAFRAVGAYRLGSPEKRRFGKTWRKPGVGSGR